MRFDDPVVRPGRGDSPTSLMSIGEPLVGTPGQEYVERRGIPLAVAESAGVVFHPNFGGRAAVLVPLKDKANGITSVHGRFLEVRGSQNKMLTVGIGNGTINVLGGWKADPFIIVEGLFDALSLATCGWSCVATIGRWASWLPEVAAGRIVWIAFDGTHSGERDFARYTALLAGAEVRRLAPPTRCKDWNTALVKRGAPAVTRWLRDHVSQTNS